MNDQKSQNSVSQSTSQHLSQHLSHIIIVVSLSTNIKNISYHSRQVKEKKKFITQLVTTNPLPQRLFSRHYPTSPFMTRLAGEVPHTTRHLPTNLQDLMSLISHRAARVLL